MRVSSCDLLFGFLVNSKIKNRIMTLSIHEVLEAGLIYGGYSPKQRNRSYAQLLVWFKANYGAHPLVYCVLWEELDLIDRERNLKYFFLCLSWLKNYDTESILAGRWNLDEKTIRLWVEYYAECLSIICEGKIQLPDEWDDDIFVGVVDGTHSRCFKPSHPEFPFDASYKSHKLGKDGLAYEVMLDMKGNPIWINGPYPAGLPDIAIYNAQLGQIIPAGKLVIGDKGYQGPATCSVPNAYDTYDVREFKRGHRARMEQYNGRLKNFRVLENTFRSKGADRLAKHKMAFCAINAIVATQLSCGFPLFDP
jgi:hypothetical protein